jgi:hypothetical protein
MQIQSLLILVSGGAFALGCAAQSSIEYLAVNLFTTG